MPRHAHSDGRRAVRLTQGCCITGEAFRLLEKSSRAHKPQIQARRMPNWICSLRTPTCSMVTQHARRPHQSDTGDRPANGLDDKFSCARSYKSQFRCLVAARSALQRAHRALRRHVPSKVATRPLDCSCAGCRLWAHQEALARQRGLFRQSTSSKCYECQLQAAYGQRQHAQAVVA